MNESMMERCKKLADHVIDTHATVRDTANKFNISKSTVHKDLSERLEHVDSERAKQVAEVFKINKDERSMRGGIATREKYREMKNH